MPEGILATIQRGETDVVSHIIFACHDLHSRRRANRLGVGVRKPHTLLRQLAQAWGMVRLTAIIFDALLPQVIRHDQDDIGLRILGRS